jgi:hypothetical protein
MIAMATAMFLAVNAVAGGFLFYFVVDFGFLKAKVGRRVLHAQYRSPASRPAIVPLQFIGRNTTAVWSVDTWDRFISNGKDSASFDISDDREGVLTRLRARIALIFLVDILGGVAILKAELRTRRSRVHRLQAGVASENSTFNSVAPSNSLAQGSKPTPGTTGESQHQEKMRVTVIATTRPGTISALQTAASFAAELGAQITLLAVEEIPRQFPLRQPPVPVSHLERNLSNLIYEAEITRKEVRVQLCLCRDRRVGLQDSLRPHSLVLMAGNDHFWSRRQRNLKAFLTNLGHTVLVSNRGRILA